MPAPGMSGASGSGTPIIGTPSGTPVLGTFPGGTPVNATFVAASLGLGSPTGAAGPPRVLGSSASVPAAALVPAMTLGSSGSTPAAGPRASTPALGVAAGTRAALPLAALPVVPMADIGGQCGSFTEAPPPLTPCVPAQAMKTPRGSRTVDGTPPAPMPSAGSATTGTFVAAAPSQSTPAICAGGATPVLGGSVLSTGPGASVVVSSGGGSVICQGAPAPCLATPAPGASADVPVDGGSVIVACRPVPRLVGMPPQAWAAPETAAPTEAPALGSETPRTDLRSAATPRVSQTQQRVYSPNKRLVQNLSYVGSRQAFTSPRGSVAVQTRPLGKTQEQDQGLPTIALIYY